MTTDNSPQKTLSRMIHNGYNFDSLPQAELDLFMPKIREHKSKCKKCLAEKSDERVFVDMILDFLDDTKSFLSEITPQPMKESGHEQLMKESFNEIKSAINNLDSKKDKEKLKELGGISKLLEMFA
jgi:hypothetical protein